MLLAAFIVLATAAAIAVEHALRRHFRSRETFWCNTAGPQCGEKAKMPRAGLFAGPNPAGLPFCRQCFVRAFGREPTQDDSMATR